MTSTTDTVNAGLEPRAGQRADARAVAHRGPAPYMNPYLAGIGLGLVLLAAYLVMGRGLGASGAVNAFVAWIVNLAAPARAQSNGFLGDYIGDGTTHPLKAWLVFEVAGVFVGALLSALLASRLSFFLWSSQMQGFAAGRLQTGGRASGLAQAALERTAEYASERKQFGEPIGNFQLTQHKIGRMATHLRAARQLTYAAALAMDKDETIALEPAMAKLFASDVTVWVTQEGQLIHGGWGYAEEFAISRHVVDARVLLIFEGVKPILELMVIARALLAQD